MNCFLAYLFATMAQAPRGLARTGLPYVTANYLLLFPTRQNKLWTIQPIPALLIITIICTHFIFEVCFHFSMQRWCLSFNLTPNERFHHSTDAWLNQSDSKIKVIAFFSSHFLCIRWNALKYSPNKENLNNKWRPINYHFEKERKFLERITESQNQ